MSAEKEWSLWRHVGGNEFIVGRFHWERNLSERRETVKKTLPELNPIRTCSDLLDEQVQFFQKPGPASGVWPKITEGKAVT